MRLTALILLGMTIACDRRVGVAMSVGALPPFESFRGIEFGMRAREIAAMRPAVEDLAYSGYRDSIPGYGVVFELDWPPMNEGMAVDPRAKLVGVRLSSRGTSTEVHAQYLAALASVREWGEPERCALSPNGVDHVVEWRRGRVRVRMRGRWGDTVKLAHTGVQAQVKQLVVLESWPADSLCQ